MKYEFWSERWTEGRIGFHRKVVTPALLEFAQLLPPPPARILVPMCGKATDLRWLADRGHDVLGVEFVRSACQAFFEENALSCELARAGAFEVFRSREPRIEIRCGDLFDLDRETLATVDGVYDRAAVVALSPESRTRYVELLAGGLGSGTPCLLVSLERTLDPEQGPPFSLPAAKLRPLYSPRFEIEALQRPEDGTPDERGFVEVAYSVRKP